MTERINAHTLWEHVTKVYPHPLTASPLMGEGELDFLASLSQLESEKSEPRSARLRTSQEGGAPGKGKRGTCKTDMLPTLLRRFWVRSLLVHSLSCLGVFSVLGSNLVLAQTKAIAATNPPTDYNNADIDPTAYNTGATRSYEAPSRVVRSRRLKGCQAFLRRGNSVSGRLCSTAALRRRTFFAVRGNQSINTVRLSRLKRSPKWLRGS